MVDSAGQRISFLSRNSIELQALSIAGPAARLLMTHADWRAVQLFDRSINLAAGGSAFISVNESAIDPGPFSISVIDAVHGARSFRQILLNAEIRALAVSASPLELQIGRLRIDLKGAQEWDPMLSRGRLSDRMVSNDIDRIFSLVDRFSPPDSLPVEFGRSGASPICSQIQLAWSNIRQALADKTPTGYFLGARLAAGAGIGLTPAGDDFLMGVLLALWLAMKEPDNYTELLIAGAKGRTGQLSMALLEAAARGEAAHAWHRLVDALVLSDAYLVDAAVFDLLNTGHTSGADALFGFVVTLRTIDRPQDDWLEGSIVAG